LNTLRHPIGTVHKGQDPKLTVRIIGRCNFRCPLCSTFSHPERKGLLSQDEMKEIISLLVREKFRGALNVSGGETSLHPDLPKMVSLASRLLPESAVVVFTNGDWVGARGWTERLDRLLGRPNVLVRFSLDRQHAQGKAMALYGRIRRKTVEAVEQERLGKARLFLAACLERGAEPGRNFDFAYKGTLAEASRYMRPLGDVPVYPLRFQRDPARRAKRIGFMAVDLDPRGRPLVFVTLGHILRGEALGGIPALPLALRMNREALRAKS